MLLIGLHGLKGVGKTTLAKNIMDVCTNRPCAVFAFAYSLKMELCRHLGVDNDFFEYGKNMLLTPSQASRLGSVIHRHADTVWPNGVTKRVAMQAYGDFRRGSDPFYFVKQTFERIGRYATMLDKAPCVIIQDVRQVNEAQAIKAYRGLLVHIEPHVGYIADGDRHVSETDLDNYTGFDMTVKCSHLDQIPFTAVNILQAAKVRPSTYIKPLED